MEVLLDAPKSPPVLAGIRASKSNRPTFLCRAQWCSRRPVAGATLVYRCGGSTPGRAPGAQGHRVSRLTAHADCARGHQNGADYITGKGLRRFAVVVAPRWCEWCNRVGTSALRGPVHPTKPAFVGWALVPTRSHRTIIGEPTGHARTPDRLPSKYATT